MASTDRCCDSPGPCEDEQCDSFFAFCQRPIGSRVNVVEFNDRPDVHVACGGNNHNVTETLVQKNTNNANFSDTVFGVSNPIILTGRLWVRNNFFTYIAKILRDISGYTLQ